MEQISMLPAQSIHQLTLADRTLGKIVQMETSRPPAHQCETDLAGDTFFSLFRGDLPQKNPMPAERMINKTLLKWAKGTEGFREAQNECAGNLPASLGAGHLFWQNLCTDDATQAALKKQDKAEKAKQQADAEQALADQMSATNDPDAGQMQQKAARSRADADQALADLQQANDKLTQSPLNRAAVAHAAQSARNQANQINSVLGGWGMGSGSPVRLSLKDAQGFMKRLNPKIVEIAKVAGRIRSIGFESRSQRVVTGFDPTDVQFTQDVRLIFPTELAKMSHQAPDILRKITVIDWAETGLMGWELTGSAEDAGDFIAMVDVSGSMDGGREIMAKGVSLGLAQVAKAERRSYRLFSFSTSRDKTFDCSSDDDWAKHLDWAEWSHGGGTDFDFALQRGMEFARGLPNGGKSADILLISDGEAGVTQNTIDQWKAFQAETSARLFYVAVARSYYQDIEALADKVIHVDDLNADAGDQIAKQVAQWI